MSDLRKAAEMALERLESHEYWMDEEAIKALRQALAMENFSEVNQEIEEALRQALAEQEPVAWVDITDEGKWSVRFAVPALSLPDGTKFYTAPPKREWVGLMKGVRVEGDEVIIATKNNDMARELCGKLIEEKNA